MSERFDVAVVGGGASGMMAALRVKTLAPYLSVALLERQPRVGKKLLATGNGRCNLTNLYAEKARYHGSLALLDEAFLRYPPVKVMEAFRGIGLHAVAEKDGRVYPSGDAAACVLDALRLGLSDRGVQVFTDFEARRVEAGFRLTGPDQTILARRVLLCGGGQASPKLGGTKLGVSLLAATGHAIAPCRPALCPLLTNPQFVRPLKGVKYRGALTLADGDRVVQTEVGEILFTDYGLSGIAAMNLARGAQEIQARGGHPQARLGISPLPFEETKTLLLDWQSAMPERPMGDFLTGLVNRRLGQTIVKEAIDAPLTSAAGALSGDALTRLARALTALSLPITGVSGFDAAQVTAGGATDADIDPKTLASRHLPGLFAAGEALNIDGDCGGFNLQWAWASGMLAADGAAKGL